MTSREKLTPKPNVGVKKDLGSFQFLAMKKGKLGFRSPLSIMGITTAIAVRKILIRLWSKSFGSAMENHPSQQKKSHRNLVGFPLLVLNIYDSYPAELHHFFRGLTTSCFTPWVRLKQSVR